MPGSRPELLRAFSAWIFDLDGTLTEPMHDFGALKRSLGLPGDQDVLAGIQTRPETEWPALHEAVAAWERDHLARARPADGAHALLDTLAARHMRLGVLTRNTRETALATLALIGLQQHFDHGDVLGRECAAAKPSPAGIHKLLSGWQLPSAEAVMVGDYVHDLEAARGAGAFAIWVDPHNRGTFRAQADRVVCSLHDLIAEVDGV
jgi:HAD superfamily hydrolase (TIGR01509 family)